MNKKIIILIIVLVFLVLVGGGIFYFWWQGGPALRALNKNLPEGFRVERKSGEQFVINRRDNYEIKIPEQWGGLDKVNYRELNGSKILNIEGKSGELTEIKTFTGIKIETERWLDNNWRNAPGVYVSPSIIGHEKIGGYSVIKTKDFGGVSGQIFFYYLRKKNNIYEFSSDSEEALKGIIEYSIF